jgi:hypothetical protein
MLEVSCSQAGILKQATTDLVHFQLSNTFIYSSKLTEQVGIAITRLIHIWEVLDSNLSRNIGHIKILLHFSQTRHANARIVPLLGDNRFLQNVLQIIIHLSSIHPILYSLAGVNIIII